MKKPIMNVFYVDVNQYVNFPNWEIYFPNGSYYCYGRCEREEAYKDFYEAGGDESTIFEELNDEELETLKRMIWSE